MVDQISKVVAVDYRKDSTGAVDHMRSCDCAWTVCEGVLLRLREMKAISLVSKTVSKGMTSIKG